MSKSQDYVDGICPAPPGSGRRLSHSGTVQESFRGGVLLIAVLMLAGLMAVPPTAQAQQQDTLDQGTLDDDRARQQRMEQRRQQREAEMRRRMKERRQEIQARIQRNAAPPAPSGVVEQDSLALVALYDSTDGDNWYDNDGWLEAPVAEWHGVTVSGDRVVGLGLDGSYSDPFGLSGPLPPEMGDLTALQNLNLEHNQLTGIPPELGQLSSLEGLFLLDNQLTGIPPELGQLSSLRDLELTNNQLTGEIPPELSQLSSLETLYLLFNQLTGQIPPELSQLSSLEVLYLDHNQLTGEIPSELSQLSSLEWLDLGNNQLTGQIPPELGQLSSLQHLELYGNQLTGQIPPELGQLSSLKSLHLSRNQLTGQIPPELGQLSSLYQLYIYSNQLTGAIPVSFANLTLMSDRKFGAFYFNGTDLCEPPDSDFQDWLDSIAYVESTGVMCEASGPPANVRLTSVNARPQDASSFSSYAPSEVTGVRSGVDLRFEGTVTDADGNPVSNVQVDVYNSLRYAPGEGDDGVRSVTTSSDGTFQYPSADEDPLSTAPLAAGVRPFWFNVRGTEEAVPFAVYVHSEEGTVENINQMLADEAEESGAIASMRIDTSDSNPFSDLSIQGKPYPPDDTDLSSSANDEFFRYYYAVYAGPTERNFLLSDDQSSGWLRRGFELHKGKVQQVLQNLPERFEDRLPPPGAFGNGSQSVSRSSGAKTSLGLDLGYWSNVASWTGKTAACGAGVAGAIGSGGIGTGGAIAFCTPLVGALQNEGFEALVNNSGFAKNIFCPGNQSVEGCTRRFAAGTFIAELGVGQFSNPKSLEVANRVLEASGAIRDIQEITGFDGSELIRDSQDRIRGLRGSTNEAFGDADLQLGVTSPRRPALEFSTVQFDDPESPSTLNVEVGSNRAIYEEGTTAQSTPAVQIEESSFSTTSLEEDENFQYQAEIPVSELPGYSGDPSTWDKTIQAEGTSFETLQGTGVGGFCGISAKTFPLNSSQTNNLSKGPHPQGPKKTTSSTLSDTKLDVPANAFGGSTSFVDFTHTSYSQVARSDQPSLRPRSPVVQVNTNRDFANPATITLGLKDGNGSSEELNVYWRGESSSWQQVPATIDVSDGTATAEITQPGYYAVLVSKTPARVVRRTEVASGWNMVGMPAEPDSAGLGPFLPSSCGPGFRWRPGQGSYQTFGSEETLPAGGGAWTFCESGGTAEPRGDPVRLSEKTVEVSAGWNQVGPFEEAIAPGAVGQEPSGLLQEGTWFRWDPAQSQYVQPSELEPGAGYWVFATESGTLDFSGGGAKAGGDRPERLAREAPEGALTLAVSDQAGQQAELHLVSELTEAARARWRLPPKGPGSVFDVRFGNGLRVAAAAGDSAGTKAGRGALMQLQGTEGTVTLRLETGRAELQGRSVRAIDPATGGERLEARLTAQSPTATVPAGTERLRVSAGSPPVEAALRKPYPNPADQQATLEYALPEARKTTVVAYDVLGRKVATLVEGEREAGRHRLQVETQRFASGVYFVRMRAEGFQQTRKITILK